VLCTRSDPLGSGKSYPPITSVLDIAANAPSPLVNAVQVTGGNSEPANATDSVVLGGPNACASLPSGNESVVNGQYAAVAQGWQGNVNATPYAIAFSVALDGTGKIKDLGGGVGGTLDLNSATTGPQNFSISSTGSFYTVGPNSDPTILSDRSPVGYMGCMRLQTSGGPFTFAFGLGAFDADIATTGAILQINDESGTKSSASGEMRIQDPSAFSSGNTTELHSNYAFGEHGGDPSGRYAIAGSFALEASTGTISSFTADQNSAGTLSNISGFGTINSVSTTDGRAVSFLQGAPGATNNNVLYIVNANEIFIIGADAFGSGIPIRSGQAVVSSGSYSASSLIGNQIVHTTGQDVCTVSSVTAPCASATLGLLNFTADSSTTGALTGTLFQYDIQNRARATSFAAGSPGTFVLATSTGRVVLGNTGSNLSVLYLANPASNSEPVTFFIVGTDKAASFGYAEQGANATVATATLLHQNYFVVNDDAGDSSVYARIGILAGGLIVGTFDYTLGGWQELGDLANDYADGLNITNIDPSNNPAPGVGTAGSGIVAITDGHRILCLVEGDQSTKPSPGSIAPPAILIAEPQ